MSRFLQDFIWGTATSSYQIEGAAYEDGKKASIWDAFCQVPGRIVNNDHGEVACDHYHLYKEDIALLKELNMQSYRFSVCWPRIFPDGVGKPNEKGLDFYKRVIDELHKQQIHPLLTLYHWDLPQALQDKGGWTNRDTVERFGEFSSCMYEQFGDVVSDWVTINEPWVISYLGHYTGEHAPGITDISAFLKSAHHVLLAHGEGVQRFRQSKAKHGKVGIVLNVAQVYPASSSAEDRQAAQVWDGLLNGWFIDAVFKGRYPQHMQELYSKLTDMSFIQPGDLERISQKTDFLGINYYSVARVKQGDSAFGTELVQVAEPVTHMDWEIAPQGLVDILKRLSADTEGQLPIVVTENGAVYDDVVTPEGEIHDDERLDYVQKHIQACQQAIAEGVDLRGYYIWSMLDNFEWAFGYDKRFGMVHVDFETLKRTPKKTAYWYRDFIKNSTTGSVVDTASR